jgi:hypothetical protein
MIAIPPKNGTFYDGTAARNILQKNGWTEADLAARRKGDPLKVRMRSTSPEHEHDSGLDRCSLCMEQPLTSRTSSTGTPERKQGDGILHYYATIPFQRRDPAIPKSVSALSLSPS